MRPAGILGVLLIVGGAIVLLLRGVSFTKEREAVRVGPVEVAAERKGFISPLVGGIAVVAGVVLVAASRRRTA
jgi:hypothetical protein